MKQKYLEYGNFYSKAFYANIYPQDNIVKAFNELLKNTDDTPAQYASKETLSIDNFYSFINYPRENLLKELDTAKYNDSVKKKLTSVKSKNSQILFSDIEKSVKILRNLVEREELAACITTIFTTCIESYDSFIKTWVTDEYLKKELSHTIQKLNLFRIWTSDLKAKGEFNRLKNKDFTFDVLHEDLLRQRQATARQQAATQKKAKETVAHIFDATHSSPSSERVSRDMSKKPSRSEA